jgi:hypothetical protein
VRTDYLFSWAHRLLAPATLPFCLIFRHRLLSWCVWQTVGWASYLIARKPAQVRGQPAFRYYLPESQQH